MSAHVGDYAYAGVTVEKVPSAATLKDLSGNTIADSSLQVVNVPLSTFTSEYLKSTLLFREEKWNLTVDIENSIYPTLICFGE